MKKIVWMAIVAAAVAGSVLLVFRNYIFTSHEQRVTSNERYQCPMHPQIIRDKPGVCPICGMTLQPIQVEEEASPEHHHPEGSFRLSPERRQTIGVKSEEAILQPLMQEIRLPGRVAFDQDLYITEQEYVEGLKTGSEKEVLGAIETKMQRLGISGEELKRLRKTKTADASLFIPKPNGPIWVYASVYEADIPQIKNGMTAVIQMPAAKNILLDGEVVQMEPILDPESRTARARIRISKTPQPIQPETYVDVVLKKDLGNALAIPADAVIETGTRQMVFVDLGEGIIEPREVTLGVKAGRNYPVVSGLAAGEKVITSAHFLLDSESQIQAAIQKFGEVKGTHQH